MIRKFDNRFNPAVRFDCENLLDSSGHALNLSGTGTIFRAVCGRTVGMSPIGVLSRGGVSDAILRDYNSMTLQAILILRSVPSATWLCTFSGSGELESGNYVWGVQLTSANSLAFFSEHGAGIDVSPAFTVAPAGKGLPAIGEAFKLDMRIREVVGGVVVQFMINGTPFGDPSPILTASSGGTLGQLLVNQSGSTVFDLLALEVDNEGLSDGQLVEAFNYTMGEDLGELETTVKSLWVGALTDQGVTVAAQLSCGADLVRLAVFDSESVGTYSSSVSVDHGAPVKFSVTGLEADQEYLYEIQKDGETLPGRTGKFRTAPAGAASFTVAFGGDSFTASNAVIFDTIREMDPLMFWHLGDLNYKNIATNNQTLFHAALDENLAQPRQAQLFAEVATLWVHDDHDSGPNNHDGSAASVPAACAVYRQRAPHYTLPHATAIYQAFDLGDHVRVLVTDQRSLASSDASTDNSSKTMLGAAQKTWLKDQFANSSGRFIIWICPRWFGQTATVGSDSWGGFTTERKELADWIKANCHARVAVVSADMHAAGIDNGSNHDFATGGGEPLRCIQAAPLDIAVTGGPNLYSEGGIFLGSNQFGTMEVDDPDDGTLEVTWTLYDGAGTTLSSYVFTVTL